MTGWSAWVDRRRLIHITQPVGFAAGYVLISFAATPTPVWGLWRPLLVVMGVALGMAVLLSLITRRAAWGGILSSLVVLSLSAPWLPLIVVAAGTLWLLLVSILRRRRGAAAPRLSVSSLARATGIVSAMFALVSVVTVLPTLAEGMVTSMRAPDLSATRRSAPEMVVVLLDGYPRSDVLEDGFGFDNADFQDALTALGFDVKEHSRSNYSATWATLASMLNGRYLHEIPELQLFPEDQAEQYRALSRAIDTSTLPPLLRRHGYEIAWVSSPFENASLTTADRLIADGQITAFELSLLSGSPLLAAIQAAAPSFLIEQHRSRIEDAFDHVPELARDDGQPTFALVHILSPHPPIVYTGEGDLAEPAECLPGCSLWALVDDEQWELFPGQIHHLNQLVVDAVSSAVSVNPDAVVVVMSDHGTQPPGSEDTAVLANFTAVRLPGAEPAVPSDVTPVNLLPEILNATLGTELQTYPYRGWISAAEYPLSMVPAQ